MRYLTVEAAPDGTAALHPLGTELRDEPSFTREAIHHVELLDDRSVLMLAEGSGDRARYAEIMRDSPYVEDFLVSGTDRWMAVSQFELSGPAKQIMLRADVPGVVVETPIHINADGSLRITYLGDESALQDLYSAIADDAPFQLDVLETGTYSPDQHSLTRILTPRQRDVLEAAVESGYYREPRRATHEDIAETVGIASTTVGEHLRKIEQRVFTALVR